PPPRAMWAQLRRSTLFYPLVGLIVVCIAMMIASPSFLSAANLENVLRQVSINAIIAVGMTCVILTGGIDLSVGSVVALTTIFCAVGAERLHWPVWVIVPLVLAFGALYGAAMGALINYFRLQPFIVTLAGMFLARGACFLITTQSITINQPAFHAIAGISVPVGGGTLSAGALIALATLAVAIYVAHFTRFGRNVYAVGGNERSALL
ncbi:sugar ABC transporter permease YjfF, partial [Bacillus licheniformis]|nr:sugar ABC transporter permease YjfF [Bacillus licheniformis]